MIGKHIPSPKGHSGSFKGLVDYITGKTKSRLAEEKIAFSDCLNLASVETAVVEMESLAFRNKRCQDPVMHLLLSWRENETPSGEQVREAVQITLEEMDLSNAQAVFSLHQNTDNLHLHICVNRIDPETGKAINPAHGWTRRGMERAARKIEFAQGWLVEENTWSEIDFFGRHTQKPIAEGIKIPQERKDVENLTGEQSAIRKAQEALKDKIKQIRNWNELHELMRENGMEYHQKGSGAVIQVGEIVVKASSVSRNLALNKLEKTLGAYQPPREEAKFASKAPKTPKISDPRPLHRLNDNENWKKYITERGSYYRDKKECREKLSAAQQSEKKTLRDRQRQEREARLESLKRGNYSKSEVCVKRSILSSLQAAERAVQKQLHKEQRDELQRLRPTFQTYEQWLRTQGLSSEADGWRHRKNSSYLQLECGNGGTKERQNPEPRGLPGFAMSQSRLGLRYSPITRPKTVSFIDLGRAIRVYRQDDDSLLGALQLAQEKWGGVQLNGDDEYKRKCAELAAKHGIRIANPNLAECQMECKVEESRDVLLNKAKELSAKRFGKPALIVTNARDEKNYEGELLGTVEHNGRQFGVQAISREHLILHDLSKMDLAKVKIFVGQRIGISCDSHYTREIFRQHSERGKERELSR